MREVRVTGDHARGYIVLFEGGPRLFYRFRVALWKEFDAKIDGI